MAVFLRIDLNLFAFFICGGMLVMNLKLSEKRMIQNRLFRLLIMATMALLLLDALGWWIDGRPGSASRLLNYIINMIAFILAPLPPTIWAYYANYLLFHDINRLKNEMSMLTIPFIINAVIVLSAPFNGLLFFVDAANLYHRGPFISVAMLISLLPMLYTAVSYVFFRKKMSRRIFVPMLFFGLPAVAGALFQIFYYGVSLIWSGLTLSIFIVYACIQNKQFYLDHLTGVYNRLQLDNHIGNRIQLAKCRADFACIMLDIDDFKSINDRFGHVVGDEALAEAAGILKSCVRAGDFLARYAGDEFVIVIDTGDDGAVERMIGRIHEKASAYNKRNQKPYQLEFSVGFDICRRDSSVTREGLIGRVDALMYRDKGQKKAAAAFI